MHRELWTNRVFSYNAPIPSWACPVCEVGSLRIKASDISEIPSRETEKSRKINSYNSTGLMTFVFTDRLICSNQACQERVVMSGKGEYWDKLDTHQLKNGFSGTRMKKFYPEYFSPHLKIIQIPRSVPEKIQDQLCKSFPLYWIDLGACANKIRVSLELILDDQSILKKPKQKTRSYSLHKRIQLFVEVQPDLADLLNAMKLLGNEGSHEGHVSISDLIDGYEIMEHLLMELYPDSRTRVRDLASRINQKKKI